MDGRSRVQPSLFGEELRPDTRERRKSSLRKAPRLQNVFRPHENEKPAFSNSSDLKSVFEKLRFRDGLVWTVGLAVEIKL